MTREDKAPGALAGIMPESWKSVLAAFSAAYGTGLLALIALPFMVSANMRTLQIDEAAAGVLSSLEFIGVFITAVVFAPRMARVDRRRIALTGAVIVVVANVASAVWGTYESLCVLRLIAGLGAGLALATGNATVSNARRPEHFAGWMTVLLVILQTIVSASFGYVAEAWGQHGVYLSLAGVVLVLMSLMLFMPRSAPERDFPESDGAIHGRLSILSLGGIAILVAMVAFSLRDTMSWAFLTSIGIEAGLTESQIGVLLAQSALIGISGPLLVVVVGSRLGLWLPLIVGIIASGLVTYGVSQSSNSALLYSISVLAWVGTYWLCVAYLTALAAEMDIHGRIAAAAGSALILGIAVGPSVGGAMISGGGYGTVGYFNNLLILITLIGALGAYRLLRKSRSGDLSYAPADPLN